MLSDEEKKAVDELKKEINNPVEVPTDKFNTFILYNIESARTILNLIEKQSKEIDLMAEEIFELQYWVSYERSTSYKTVEDVKRLFEERCK